MAFSHPITEVAFFVERMKITIAEFKKTYGFEPAPRIIKDGKIVCGKCENGEANHTLGIGLTDCDECQEKSNRNWKPIGEAYEFVPDRIKEERAKNFNSIIQPWRDGVPSKEFAEAYPQKAQIMFKGESPQYVWKDQRGWSTREKSY